MSMNQSHSRASAAGRFSLERASQLVTDARRVGDWATAAAWLADRLNALDAHLSTRASRSTIAAQRADLRAATSALVFAIDADMLEADVIAMSDGTRVCWHAEPADGWVVERVTDTCAYQQLAAG